MFGNNSHVHVDSPRVGQTSHAPGSKAFQKHKSSVNLVICCKFYLVSFFPIQPRVIIYMNIVGLESSLPHAKYQDHRTSGSGE